MSAVEAPIRLEAHEPPEMRGRGRDDVHAVDALEHVERVLRERRLRARPEQARVVDEQVEPPGGGSDERAPMARVGDVAGDRRHVGHILAKLGVTDRTQAALLAVRAGFSSC